MIDWEFAGVRTNPGIHAQEDQKVRLTMAEGKSYSPDHSSDAILESHTSGKAS